MVSARVHTLTSIIGKLRVTPRALRPEFTDIQPPCKFSAADQGHAAAQYELSRLYDEGDGVNQSFGRGRKWATKAAAGGNLEAQIDCALYLAAGGKQLRNVTDTIAHGYESEVRRDASLFFVAGCRSPTHKLGLLRLLPKIT